MKQTNILRRVDNLGRIVLPKHIRHKFNLTLGSQVLIDFDENQIFVKPYHKLNNLGKLLKKCVKIFDTNLKVFVCNTQNVLESNFCVCAPKDFFEFLQTRTKKIFYGTKDFKFFENQKTLGVFPITSNGDLFGAFVILSPKFVQNFDFVLPVVKLIEESLND